MQHDKNLLNQSEIANKLGVNRSTISRFIKENGVAPQQIKGRQKFYDATIVQQFKQVNKKKKEVKKSGNSSNDELLNQVIAQQREEIAELKNQVKEKDEIIKSNNEDLVEISKQLAKLTSQAQQLNLLDKPKQIKNSEENVVAKNETETTTATKKKHWWSIFR